MAAEQPTPGVVSGSVIDGRYRLESLLGSGGSSAVYRGIDQKLGRTVAIKFLSKSDFAGGLAGFQAEAMAASRVNHPNAIAIYDIGTFHDRPYLVMEEVLGTSLAELLESGPLEVDRTVRICAQVLDALAEAHRCGVVHCDLSSDNVLIDDRNGADHVTVIDFGLARLGGNDGQQRIVGTAEYLAPEQIAGGDTTPAVDLYAVGVLLFESLMGRTPFAGANEAMVLKGHLEAVPPLVHETLAGCSASLGELIAKALAKTPSSRPSSADDMRLALIRSASNSSKRHRTEGNGIAPRVSLRLIGRKEEQETTRRFLLSEVGALFVSGPEGVGKRRLVEETARDIGGEVQLLTASAPLGPAPSWTPILGLLQSILGVSDPTLASLTRAVAQLGLPARDVPGLADLFGVGPLRDLDREDLRTEALASAKRVVEAAARRLPRKAILFADIERFDRPSRDFAVDIARSARERGYTVIITGETETIVPWISVLPLKPLSAESTKALLDELVPEATRLEGAGAMSSGSPAHIEQLAAWLCEERLMQQAPSTLVDLISQRILRAPAQSRVLIQALAALGGSAPLSRLEALIPGVELHSVPALVTVDAQAARLCSRLIIQVALACTPADARRRLHRAAAEHCRDEAPVIRARHAQQAEDFERAYSMFMKAGHDAFSRFDSPGAARLYGLAADCARALHRRGHQSSQRDLIAAVLLASEAMLDCDKPRLAVGFLDEAELLTPAGTQLAAYERARGRVALKQRGAEQGRVHLGRCVATGLVTGDLELVCDAYLELAESMVQEGLHQQAADELRQAIDVATGGIGWTNARAPKRLWRIGHRLAELLIREGSTVEARQIATEALAHARRRDSKNGQARISALMAQICEEDGDFASALRYRANAIKGLRKLGDRRSTAEVLFASAGASSSGDRGQNEQTLDFAEILADEIGWSGPSRERGEGEGSDT